MRANELLKLADAFLSVAEEPDDPKRQDYLNRRRQQYLSDKLKREEAPWQATEEHRAKLRERQQRFQEKLDPQKRQEIGKQQWVEKQQLMRSPTLEGLSIKLRQQIAEAKSSLSRGSDQAAMSDFLQTAPKLYALREDLKSVMQAEPKPSSTHLIPLIDEVNTLIFATGRQRAIASTLSIIKSKLEELL